MIEVFSTNIKRLGFARTEGEVFEPGVGDLWVDFSNGTSPTYVYEGVPAQTFFELLAAQSRGQFLHQRVQGQYPFRVV